MLLFIVEQQFLTVVALHTHTHTLIRYNMRGNIVKVFRFGMVWIERHTKDVASARKTPSMNTEHTLSLSSAI